MEQELSLYLVPEIIEWLIQNFIQQPIVLADFTINARKEEMILHISSNLQFVYTFSYDASGINRYDLHSASSTLVTKLDRYAAPCMRSMQHPQYIGFFKEKNKKDQKKNTLTLVDVTTGKILHEWQLDCYLNMYYKEVRYIWDEKLNLLVPSPPYKVVIPEYATLKDVLATENIKDLFEQDKIKISHAYQCYFLSFNQDHMENRTFTFIRQRSSKNTHVNVIEDKINYLHNNYILHIFKTNPSYNDHKIVHICPHVVEHYICNTPLLIEDKFIIVSCNLNRYLVLQSVLGTKNNKKCICQ